MRVATSRQHGRTVILAAALGLVLAACAADDTTTDADTDTELDTGATEDPVDGEVEDAVTDDDPEPVDLEIVATTSIFGDIVAQLLGDDGEVTVLMDPGVDPHAYQPSAAEAALLREADLVIANGLMLEENLLSALEAAEEEGVRVLEVAEHLDPIEFDWDGPGHGHDDDDHGHGHDDEDDHGHGHDDDDHEHGPQDPHVWFDPIRMADGVDLIAAELAEVYDAIDADEWQARADAYNEELLAVHEQMEERFAAIPSERRRLVTNHDALGYLANRYDLQVVGTVIPGSTTQAEADAGAFAELIETVEAAGVPAVFAENTDSTVLAEQLTSEVIGRGDLEIEVVRIYTDALAEEGSGADTYLGLLRTTSELIADALG